jgi:hypothetical protein
VAHATAAAAHASDATPPAAVEPAPGGTAAPSPRSRPVLDPVSGGVNAPEHRAAAEQLAAAPPRPAPPPGEAASTSVERRPAPVVGEAPVPPASGSAE